MTHPDAAERARSDTAAVERAIDESLFPDPQRFDIDRPNLSDHLAFSTGVHYCLGGQLARGLARAAVPAILALPGIRPAAAPGFYGWQFRGPLSVPVTLTPAAG